MLYTATLLPTHIIFVSAMHFPRKHEAHVPVRATQQLYSQFGLLSMSMLY